MTLLLVASSGPRAGRSLIAAALAYRFARDGNAVTLARLSGDDSATADATAFAELESVISPGRPVEAKDIASLTGHTVIEAPPGSVKGLAASLNAKVIAVGLPASPAVDAAKEQLAGTILTRVPDAEVAAVASRAGVIAVVPEDNVLAAPSVADIAATLNADWLAGEGSRDAIGRVMLGTVASDAASPYFANRQGVCVITRFDKTDIQLAALQTDIECLVMTGGGEPSPYLLDRVRSTRDQIAVLQTAGSTVESMTAIEALFGASRFEGQRKLLRAVELLDAAGLSIAL
jgi:BioD-like phosphotransacetylase family protein